METLPKGYSRYAEKFNLQHLVSLPSNISVTPFKLILFVLFSYNGWTKVGIHLLLFYIQGKQWDQRYHQAILLWTAECCKSNYFIAFMACSFAIHSPEKMKKVEVIYHSILGCTICMLITSDIIQIVHNKNIHV